MDTVEKAIHSFALTLITLFAPLCDSAPIEDADARIRALRTREVVLELRDDSGGALGDTAVEVEMTRHQFLFGGNLYLLGSFEDPADEERYRELFSDLFNFATVPFYLVMHEADGSRRDGSRLSDMVRWSVAHDVSIKGHPLVWHFPSALPDWLSRDPREVRRVHRDRIAAILEQWRGSIGFWDVVNEPTLAWLYDTPVSEWHRAEGPVTVTRDALAWAREADPDARRIVNEVNVGLGPWHLLALARPRRAFDALWGPIDHHFFSFRDFLVDLDEAGGEFDGIGVQAHMHTGVWPLNFVWQTCERFADLGRPLHWSELTVLSGEPKIIHPDDPGWQPEWPSTPEGEAAQAAYVRDLYTLLFSHPAVASITWWDLADRDSWLNAPAGLVRVDLSRKPAYDVLRELIRERWWTHAVGRSDARGAYRLRGYCGDHRVRAVGGGERASASFRIDCAQPDGARIVVSLDAAAE